jgi:hypothetical protein
MDRNAWASARLGQDGFHVLVRTRDHMHRNDLADLAGCCRAGIGGCLHRTNVATHHHGHQAATDLLARDANLAWVVLDLRGVSLIRLSRLPSLPWYRLQRAVESSGVAGLILSPLPLIPCSRVRLRLRHSHAFATLHEGQSTLATQLQAEVDRNRSAFVHVAGA